MTESGTCVPAGPSRKAVGRSSAEKRARTAATSSATALIGQPLACERGEGVWGNREVPPQHRRRGPVGETWFPPRERAEGERRSCCDGGRLADEAPEPRDPLVDLLRGRIREGEPHRLLAAACEVEVGALHERDLGFGRLRLQLVSAEAAGEVDPEEVAPVRLVPGRALGHLALESGEHGVAADPQARADVLHVRVEAAAAQELVEGRLDEDRGGDVVLEDEALDRGHQLLGEDDVADADPGSDGLREGGEEDGPLASRELEDPGQGLAGEAKEPVRIVLEDDGVRAAREVEQTLAARARERPPARVLKGP